MTLRAWGPGGHVKGVLQCGRGSQKRGWLRCRLMVQLHVNADTNGVSVRTLALAWELLLVRGEAWGWGECQQMARSRHVYEVRRTLPSRDAD